MALSACSSDMPEYTSFSMMSSAIPRPAGYIKQMPGVPLFPGAHETEAARPYNIGYMTSDNSMQAVYRADNASLPTLLRFYRNNMRDMGWTKHPDMELYRAPDGRQVHITFMPQAGGSFVRFKQGYDIMPQSEWNYAFNRNKEQLYTPASHKRKSSSDNDGDAMVSASLF